MGDIDSVSGVVAKETIEEVEDALLLRWLEDIGYGNLAVLVL